MRYHEAASFLFGLRRFRMKPGTAATTGLLEALDDPHEGPTFVQIAGSNGKGSTARMVESVLREAGFDVGLYTSPHLDDLRERVLINGRPIPRSAVREFVAAIREYVVERQADGDGPTFFEVLTAMALWHFGHESVDIAVLEVGIGGQYDATSAIEPTASAVTGVSLEHTEVLGDTVAEIASDKAHVAPTAGPLVTAATGEALAAIREAVDDVLVIGEGEDADVNVRYGGLSDTGEGRTTIEGPDWTVKTLLGLVGVHQARNAAVATTLARQIANVNETTIARGLRAAHWPARFEVLSRSPLIVLDGAHNPDACRALADTLSSFEYDRLSFVFGAMHDKDVRGMADALPQPDRVVACEPSTERAADPAVLARMFEREAVNEVRVVRSVENAVEEAIASAGADDCVLITGSLHTVAEARVSWTRTVVPRRVESVDDASTVLEGAHVADVDVWRIRDAGVHRVLQTRVLPRQVGALREAMLRAGGECAVSAIAAQNEEFLDVVLLGTRDQFETLRGSLGAESGGLRDVKSSVRAALEEDTTGPVDLGTPPDRREHPWVNRTAVMGILNVTPDSFHDGGAYDDFESAIAKGERLVEAGADIVDVGGESTRPGAESVDVDVEVDRVVPVVEGLADTDAMVSVDTRKAAVAEAALEAGADMLNDVSGLADPAMRFVAATHDVPIVVMHSIDAPVVPGNAPTYDDVVRDVLDGLVERVLLAERAGLNRSQIIIDPGLGFGKTAAESFALLNRLDELHALGCPVMVGHSYKSMFDDIGGDNADRAAATVGATALAAARGVDIVRVHDVAENLAAVRVATTVANGTREPE